MTRRTPSTHTLAAAAAISGSLQLVATLELSLSSDGAVLRAAREGPTIYLVAAALFAAFAALVVWQRHRPWLVCAGLAMPGLLAAGALVWLSGSILGLAYHGELLLHHFLAALCAAACVAVPLAWAREPALGRLRALPSLVALPGASLLLAEHLQRAPGAPIGLMGQVGTATLLLAAPLSLAALWPHLQPPRMRLAAAIALLPLAVRVGLGGADALKGMSLGTSSALPILASLGLASLVVFALVRPRAERGLRGLALGLAGIACLALHRAYTQRFGELEVTLGGLARSLLGFELPYPGYLPPWQVIAALLVLFAAFSLAVHALLSRRDHVRGLCLALLLVAGLGLSSPQLVLMVGAGLLLSLDTLAGAPPPPPTTTPPPRPVEAIVTEAAALLGVSPPTVLEQQQGAVVALRGDIKGTPIELRARHERAGWVVVAQAGTLGRGAPELELAPGDPEDEPHPLLGTHALKGDARRAERLPESLLLALQHFPDHRTRLWGGGCQIDLGGRLDRLESASLAAVLRAMSQAT